MRNLAVMTSGRLATQAVLVVSAFLIPRVLGAEDYGLFAAIMAVVSIVQTGSAFGLPTVEVRFLAPLWQRADRAPAETLAATLWTARVALAVVGSAVLMVWILLSPQLGVGASLCGMLGVFALLRFALEATKSLLLPLGRVGGLAALDFARAALTLPAVIFLFPGFGMLGAFTGMTVLQGGLLVSAFRLLRRVAPVSPARFDWSMLRPHAPFAAATFVGALSSMFQVQFSVFAVASWVTREEAGYLGISVQLYSLLQVLFISARRSLMPILSELQAAGQDERLAYWGSVMMRYSAASLSLVVVIWALLGEAIVGFVLTDAFAPVYSCATLILVATAFFCCGASCNGLLFVRELPRVGSTNSFLYALTTVVGLLWVVEGPNDGAAFRISAVYAAAGAFFFAFAYTSLGWRGGLWLPLGRTLALLLPMLAAWPAATWSGGGAERVAVAVAFPVAYAALAVGLGLLPRDELREIVRTARRASS
ncbi:MAG: hypothetical protein HRU01_01120 [Myxococcales bacterium]|nr:hypothetical protein [Myxococcales bacterium]